MALCDDFKNACPRLTCDVVDDALYFLKREGFQEIKKTVYTDRAYIVLEGEDIPDTTCRKGVVINYNPEHGVRSDATICFPMIDQVSKDEDGEPVLHQDRRDAMVILADFVAEKRNQQTGMDRFVEGMHRFFKELGLP